MTDDFPRHPLTQRQERLLEILIREYIAAPEPVSSKNLSVMSDLGLSSASIRNEMSVLEEAGYIRAPHTSAGRVPTEEGYRYFVKRLLNEGTRLPELSEANIRTSLQIAPSEMDAWMQNAVLTLAQQTHSAALVTEPRLHISQRFKQVQLIGVQGRLVLMVLVIEGGHVHQQMLIMAEPIAQENLAHTSEVINRSCVDMTAEQVRDKTRNLGILLAQDIGELVADALQQLSGGGSRVGYKAGLVDVLGDFEDDGAQQAIQVFEGTINLDDLMDERQGAVQVIVGGEGRWEQLRNLSVVLARYRTTRMIGTVGVLGPTRMHYGQAISSVSLVAELISSFLSEVHGELLPPSSEGD